MLGFLRSGHICGQHHSSSVGSPSYDHLGKVRLVIDELSKKFTELYEEVAVDEAMIKFTGRSSVKKYMPMKPIKLGVKVHGILIIHAHGGLAHGVHNLVSL